MIFRIRRSGVTCKFPWLGLREALQWLTERISQIPSPIKGEIQQTVKRDLNG